MKLGVFDSGVGGLSVANVVQDAFPEYEVVLREDHEHVPYGTRTPQELFTLVVPIFQSLIDDGCALIVVACNTVSTTIIEELRQEFDVPLIAVEPMIAAAAERTKHNIIAVCATPTTLGSDRYDWLKREYASDLTVLEPDCSDWAHMIEHKRVDGDKIASRITAVLDDGADVIVLGCTHYHWIEEDITALAKGRATVLQPEALIIKQLQNVLRNS